MRRLAAPLSLALLSPLGCNDPAPTPMSYALCSAPTTCGISTRCDAVRVTTTGAPASLCTAPCVSDLECPGWAGRCVPNASADGGASRCLLGCSTQADCRTGTVCMPMAGADAGVDGAVRAVCAPDLGLRPCAQDRDCAPFALRCAGVDGGVAELRCRPTG